MGANEEMGLLIQQPGQNVIGKLYDKYAPLLLGVIRRIVGNDKVAEDILQMSFIEIWENKKAYDPSRERLFTWMLRIAKNAALGVVRSVKAGPDFKTSKDENYVADSDFEIDPGYAGDKMFDLKEDQRTALNLVYFRGYTFAEAARKLNIPAETLRSMVIGAVKNLKQMVAV